MLYKEYGKTGKKVSAIAFGGMRFKEDEYKDGDLTRCAQIVKRASDLGINYFDTAPGYCHDMSEKILGTAFQEMKRDSFYVSTKCGLWNAKTADEARKRVEMSLKNLNVSQIDFYHLWCLKNMEDYNEFMKPNGIYEGVRKAFEEGLIGHVCFSTHMNSTDIRQVVQTGLFDGVTLGYNAINFAFRQEGIHAAYENGLGVLTMNPLGGGMIPNSPDYFSFLKQGQDSIVVAALKFIISQQQVTAALCGFSSEKELEENVLAAESLYRVDENYLEKMSYHLTKELNKLCTLCGYCDGCPKNIPIPKLMSSYNHYIFSGGKDKAVLDYMKGHWAMTNEVAGECINCGKCEKLCTQKLPIMERLNQIANMENK